MNSEHEKPVRVAQSILFVLVRKPDGDSVESSKANRVAKIVEGDQSHTKGVQILTSGTYLIDAVDGMPFLGLAIYQCDQEGLEYTVLLLGENPMPTTYQRCLSEAKPTR